MRRSAVARAALLVALLVTPAFPGASRPGGSGADALDFWVGAWTVQSQDGTKAGDNRIEKVLGGAAILEHWTDVDGSTGKSFFYFLPASGRWKQVWVESTGTVVKEELFAVPLRVDRGSPPLTWTASLAAASCS